MGKEWNNMISDDSNKEANRKDKGKDRRRLLFILDTLRENATKRNFTVAEMCEVCDANMYHASPTTIRDDLDAILASYKPVVRETITPERPRLPNGKIPNAYGMNPSLDPGEYRLLVDLLLGTYFLTADETETLIQKLTAISGYDVGSIGELTRFLDKEKKSRQSPTQWNIEAIINAMKEKKKVSFQYLEYDANLGKIRRNKGETYEVSPVVTKVDKGRYYLYGYCHNREAIRTFRIGTLRVRCRRRNRSFRACLCSQCGCRIRYKSCCAVCRFNGSV